MAGNDAFVRVRVAVEQATAALRAAADAFAEIAASIPDDDELVGGEIPAPGGEFMVDETSVSIQDGPRTKRCSDWKEHASHLWFEGDNISPWDCPGIGPELDHLLCDDSRMHDGHIWTTAAGERVWCHGMPF